MAKSENKRRTKGEGSLEFNEKKKKWVARITAHRADGSSFRKTFEGKTQKEAKSKWDERFNLACFVLLCGADSDIRNVRHILKPSFRLRYCSYI